MHRDPPRVRARPTLLDDVASAASERLAKVTVGNPTAEGVRMGALASLEQREEVRRSLKALLDAGSVVFGDPEQVDVVDADAERGAFISPVLLKARPGALRAARGRGVRPGLDAACRTRPPSRSSTSPLAAAAAWPGRSSAPTRSSCARSCSARRPTTAGCWCWTPTTRRSPPATARRCRSWSTAAPAAPVAARRWAASAACCTTCSARPSRARPAVLTRGHRPLGHRRAARRRRRPPVPEVPGRAADRRLRRRRAAHGHARRTSTTSPSSPATRSTPTPTRGGGRGQPAVRRDRRARLPGRLVRGRPVRLARARPGAGQLRPGEPAVPDAGQGRRRADRDADRQADHPARSTRSTARSAGTPTSPTQDGESVAKYDVLTLVAKEQP